MLTTKSAEQVAREAIALAQASAIVSLLFVVESGCDLYACGGSDWLGSLPEEHRQRIRDLRGRMVERDLYEFIYGPLPARCCDPDSHAEPDFDAAAAAHRQEGR